MSQQKLQIKGTCWARCGMEEILLVDPSVSWHAKLWTLSRIICACSWSLGSRFLYPAPVPKPWNQTLWPSNLTLGLGLQISDSRLIGRPYSCMFLYLLTLYLCILETPGRAMVLGLALNETEVHIGSRTFLNLYLTQSWEGNIWIQSQCF